MKDLITTSTVIVLSMTIILLLIYYLTQRFYNLIWIPYKKSVGGHSFEDLILILRTVINTELDAYENDVFRLKGSLTNSNFNQFYLDITKKISQDIPDEFLDDLKQYLTQDAIFRIIGREVKKFLEDHIHGTY